MSDVVTHINGDAKIVGAMQSFADENLGNCYGNGNAEVLFSSAVLRNLPTNPLSPPGDCRIVSWSKVEGTDLRSLRVDMSYTFGEDFMPYYPDSPSY